MRLISKLKHFSLWGVTILFCYACSEIIPLEVSESSTQLVVQGSISNGEYGCQVSLRSTTDIDGIGGTNIGIGAMVEIEEIGGDRFALQELGPGYYVADATDFIGISGRSYQLHIQLSNGKTFQSDVQTIPEPVTILDNEVAFIERSFFNENLIETREPFHDITLTIANNSSPQYIKWDSYGWSQVAVDYTLEAAGPQLCWALKNPISRNITLLDNRGLAGNNYQFLAASVPFDFKTDYVAVFTAKTMNENNYGFWLKVEDQLQRSGGLFERPYGPIVGNISGVNNDDPVLGYFHGYGATKYSVCFNRAATSKTYRIPIVSATTLCTQFWSPAQFETPQEFDFCDFSEVP